MSTPPSSKKPTLVANVILLGIVVVLIGAVAGGGWWAVKKFVLGTKKAPPTLAKVNPDPTGQAPPAAPRETPATKKPPASPGVFENPRYSQEAGAATTTTPAASGNVAKKETESPLVTTNREAIPTPATPAEQIDDAKLPGSIPGTTPGATSPSVTAATDPDVVTTTPNTAIPAKAATPGISDDPSEALPPDSPGVEVPVQQDEPVTVFQEDSPEVRALKEDADRRIAEAPADLYPDREKSRVRSALRNAKRLARVATLHFAPGATRLGRGEEARLKKALLTREASDLMEDAEAAIVCIGFADQSGDPQRNKEISKQRAMGAINLLKKLGVTNVTYPVAIGGTELVASGNRNKNRAVEVWIVLP
ncbi:MAG: hypothetical protein ACR2OZ_00930 [Verrucomicrobiales bacterium]